MAATTLSAVPSSFYQGDTLDLLVELSDYSAADGWVLSYYFKNSGGNFSITSAASGAKHAFAEVAADTATWLPGVYAVVGKVTDGTSTHTVSTGQIEILRDLSTSENFDTRSHAKKCLDAINLVLEGKATRDVLQTTIAGQSIGRMSFNELLAAKAHYQDLVSGESVSAGTKGRNILVRFGNA
jgi:hypothetical protein